MRRFHLKVFLLIILWPANSLAGILETGYRADYKLYASGFYVASTTRHLIKVENGMEYRTNTQPAGMATWFTTDTLVEVSKFNIDKNGVSAQSYHYQQSGDDGEKIIDITFDHNQQTIQFSNDSKVHNLQPESYDALSFQIALMDKLSKGDKQLTPHVADQNGLFSYDAWVAGSELIQTGVGKLSVIKVLMKNRTNNNLFTFWCAPKYDYLPVRIELHREESGIDSMLEINAFH